MKSLYSLDSYLLEHTRALRIAILLAVLGLVLALSACSVAPAKPVQASEPKILSFVGLGACGKWMGGIVVMSDGQVHGSGDITAEQGKAIADKLPKGTTIIAMAPCVSEDASPKGLQTRL